eukprot:scaffold1097_cov246-Pinguiococcus_pyrenoidosus.AAC.2
MSKAPSSSRSGQYGARFLSMALLYASLGPAYHVASFLMYAMAVCSSGSSGSSAPSPRGHTRTVTGVRAYTFSAGSVEKGSEPLAMPSKRSSIANSSSFSLTTVPRHILSSCGRKDATAPSQRSL